MGKTITIIILAVATVGLAVSTVLLAINSSSKDEQIEQLTADIKKYDDENNELSQRINLVGTATCLMEGYNYTNKFTISECKSIVKFISEEKTNADIKQLLGY